MAETRRETSVVRPRRSSQPHGTTLSRQPQIVSLPHRRRAQPRSPIRAMDGNWQPVQGSNPSEGGGWRSQLAPDARSRIVNKIMITLKKYMPVSEPEGLDELQRIAVLIEEKIYNIATNQSDYLRNLSLKMLSMETNTQQAPGNAQVLPNQNNPGQG